LTLQLLLICISDEAIITAFKLLEIASHRLLHIYYHVLFDNGLHIIYIDLYPLTMHCMCHTGVKYSARVNAKLKKNCSSERHKIKQLNFFFSGINNIFLTEFNGINLTGLLSIQYFYFL
jgi:hypothetical protein